MQAKLSDGVKLMEQLLSKNITDCFPQVCTILNEASGSSWRNGITTPLFMFLENGCLNHLSQTSSNTMEKSKVFVHVQVLLRCRLSVLGHGLGVLERSRPSKHPQL